MHPILIDWGPIVIPSWHAFYVLGALAALVLLLWLGRRHAPLVARTDLARMFAVCYVAGYLGARLLSIAIEEPESHSPGGVIAALLRFGPMTFYGGAIASFVAGAAFARVRGISLATLVDIGLPAGLLALAIGRVGCFLNGDDYGTAAPLGEGGTAPFWAVTFPSLGDGIARYPVQLLEAAVVLLMTVVLCRYLVRLRVAFRPGIVGFLAIVGYANCRFLIEFLRDDFRGFAFGTWLSTSQFISVLVLAAAGVAAPFCLRRPKK